MTDFGTLWREVCERSSHFPVVQNREELEYVFNLIRGCGSYLEVGTAEGNSLYVLAHALLANAPLAYVDYGEAHTTPHRQDVLLKLAMRGHPIRESLGDSNSVKTADKVRGRYDVVLIDAGHTLFNVTVDALFYGPMAKKYVIFHDICLPEVAEAFEWYAEQRSDCIKSRIVNSERFGFGVLEVTQT